MLALPRPTTGTRREKGERLKGRAEGEKQNSEEKVLLLTS
jgi:hypothetical protein